MSRDRDRERDDARRRAVHDTPGRPLTRMEREDIIPFLADEKMPTLPPPPARLAKRQDEVLTHIRGRTPSGSFSAEELMGEQREWLEEVLQRRILEERLTAQTEQAREAKAEVAKTREFWRGVAALVIGGVILAAICWAASELVRHAGR